MISVLLTGGAGYIGSHTYVALVMSGFRPIILDDFSNSTPGVLDRLQRISHQSVVCEFGSVADLELVESLIKRYQIQAVIHCAGFKATGESVMRPLKYFANNIGGTTRLLQAMDRVGCSIIIFSSSATVYGSPTSVPIRENFSRCHTNPYGHTKLVCEDMLAAMRVANPEWRTGVLRYFNPVGAHPSGLIGENPRGIPNNLMPYLTQVAIGKMPYLNVYGNDYATADGTGVRDYIHVQDLASGHVAALQALLQGGESFTVNLGTGQGYSVLEVIRAFEAASGRSVPFRFVPRRRGDVPQSYADPSLAQTLLGWHARLKLNEMCADAWRWQRMNPDGFSDV